ncbi:MAG: DNA/RNA nuclease SfsA [Firmicutes bacterium]|nr:DNA/RNA nuclease SfsA [Bacillota bacterium]
MVYERIIKGQFIARPNRFIAEVKLDDREEQTVRAHVKNTGRCRELLVPGATVYLEDFREQMGSRKLAFSLIGVEKQMADGNLMVNMDSQAPNKVTGEGLKSGALILPGMDRLAEIRPETTYGNSRFDFYVKDEIGQQAFIEVKGVTLENHGVVRFPDAPTERGVKHVEELIRACHDGYRAYVLFVIQMEGMKEFRPNDETHKAFGDALREARRQGVEILAWECKATPNSLQLARPVPVNLKKINTNF